MGIKYHLRSDNVARIADNETVVVDIMIKECIDRLVFKSNIPRWSGIEVIVVALMLLLPHRHCVTIHIIYDM